MFYCLYRWSLRRPFSRIQPRPPRPAPSIHHTKGYKPFITKSITGKHVCQLLLMVCEIDTLNRTSNGMSDPSSSPPLAPPATLLSSHGDGANKHTHISEYNMTTWIRPRMVRLRRHHFSWHRFKKTGHRDSFHSFIILFHVFFFFYSMPKITTTH